MKQAEVNRAVARATGESVSTIQRLGFLLADPLDAEEPGPLVIDWDALEAARPPRSGWKGEHAPAVA